MDKNGYLKQYYGSYREDARLSAAKHGLVEYLTTRNTSINFWSRECVF